MKLVLIAAILAISLIGCNKPAVTESPSYSPDEFLKRDLTKASSSFPYRVYVPKDRSPGERLPVMLYLHGADERATDNQLQLRGLAEQVRSHSRDFRFIVVVPQCPPNRFWDSEMITLADRAMDQAIAEFDGDESRLYLAGFSLGGYGVWSRAVIYPQRFAALISMSGRVLPRPGERKNLSKELLELADRQDPYAAYAQRIGKVPAWIVQGADDKIVPPEGSRRIVQALRSAGNDNVQYSELPGIGHYTVDSAFGNPELFAWLARQKLTNISYENVPVTDDIAYGEVIQTIAYEGEEYFGRIAGGNLINLKRETISPDEPTEINELPALADDIRQDFIKNNKVGDKLRSDGYDAKVFMNMTEQSGSIAEIYDHNKSIEPKLYGVVGLSKVGYDANHSRSLVYVEFYNTQKKLVKNYSLINWKREGMGLSVSSRRWLL